MQLVGCRNYNTIAWTSFVKEKNGKNCQARVNNRVKRAIQEKSALFEEIELNTSIISLLDSNHIYSNVEKREV